MPEGVPRLAAAARFAVQGMREDAMIGRDAPGGPQA
jgi:hypothetical protein